MRNILSSDIKRIFVLTALFLGATVSQASSLTVIHGITGQDVGLDPELPVDIALNGDCTLEGAEFGAVTSPLDADPGLYDVEIRLADMLNPCSGDLAIEASISISFGEDASVIAHLTPEGTITATKFSNDVRPTDAGNSRVVIRHTADAPAVDVFAFEPKRYRKRDDDDDNDIKFLRLAAGLENPQQAKSVVASGRYKVVITPAGERIPVLGPTPLTFSDSEASFVYAVGNLGGGTLTLLIQTVALTP
jgi:hypothetical protein